MKPYCTISNHLEMAKEQISVLPPSPTPTPAINFHNFYFYLYLIMMMLVILKKTMGQFENYTFKHHDST